MHFCHCPRSTFSHSRDAKRVFLALPVHPLSYLQEMRSNRRSVGCQHLLLGLATHVLAEATPVGVGCTSWGCMP